ncbi:unnamed protein product, partial [Heterosigma akashiwo]
GRAEPAGPALRGAAPQRGLLPARPQRRRPDGRPPCAGGRIEPPGLAGDLRRGHLRSHEYAKERTRMRM